MNRIRSTPTDPRRRGLPARVWAASALLAAVALSGCVDRRLIVRSDPPGARVFVDGAPRGRTPASIPFSFYGTREVTVRLEGRPAARREVELAAPWYQWIPAVDLVAEALVPVDIEDHHEVLFVLAEAPATADLSTGSALAARAERALAQARSSRSETPDRTAP